MRAILVIPARLDSQRLPGKVLLRAGGKSILRHVYEKAACASRVDAIFVATDHETIADEAHACGAQAIMTSRTLANGSERVLAACASIAVGEKDIIVNLQGDEPDTDPAHIDALIAAKAACGDGVATLACRFDALAFAAEPADPSNVKIALDDARVLAPLRRAWYFSRSPIPSGTEAGAFWLHMGLYAYSLPALQRYCAFPACAAERSEKLEQLRWLAMEVPLWAQPVSGAHGGIDTREDYARFAENQADLAD